MKTATYLLSFVSSVPVLVNSAHAAQVDVQVTADNAYAIYTGTSTTVTDYWASATNTLAQHIAQPESYSFTMNDGDAIYVVAWSDDSTAQGLLAEFSIDGTIVTTASTYWEVMATGIDLDVTDPAPLVDELTTQVQLGNAGGGASSGWVTPTLGDLNDGSAVVNVPLMASYVQWAWYLSAGAPTGGDAFSPGFNHDEYLIFRMVFPMTGCCVEESCLNTTPEDCADLGGISLEEGQLCENIVGECIDNVEETGACCTKEDCVDLTREDCALADGVYLGDEVDCADVTDECEEEEPVELGACCVDGECLEMEEEKCIEFDGEFAGVGVACVDVEDECIETTIEDGACCKDETCIITDEQSCDHAQGTFYGVGSDCDSGEVTCDSGDDTTGPVGTSDPIEEARPAKGCSTVSGSAGVSGLLGIVALIGLRRRQETGLHS